MSEARQTPPNPTLSGEPERCLVLGLLAGDQLLIQGAHLSMRRRTEIALHTVGTRFVFGKQYMTEAEATTPLRRLYFLTQQLYAGPEESHPGLYRELDALPSHSRQIVLDTLSSKHIHHRLKELGERIRRAESGA